MKNSLYYLAFVLIACQNKQSSQFTEGTETIFIETSDTAIIKQQIDLFNVEYPETKFNIVSTEETNGLNAFLADSVDHIIIDRKLTAIEMNSFANKNLIPKSNLLAAKSLAIIVNNANNTSEINQKDISSFFEKQDFVLIDKAGSSLHRYLREKYPTCKIKEAGSIEKMISLVESGSAKVALIPADYLIDKTTNRYLNAKRVKALNIINSLNNKSYSAIPSNLENGKYPLYLEIYLHNSSGKTSAVSGLSFFILSDRGQLICKKAGWFNVRRSNRNMEIVD